MLYTSQYEGVMWPLGLPRVMYCGQGARVWFVVCTSCIYYAGFLFVSMMVVCVMYAHGHSLLSPPQSSLLRTWFEFDCMLSHCSSLVTIISYQYTNLHCSLFVASLHSVVNSLFLLSFSELPRLAASSIVSPRTALGSAHLLVPQLYCRLSLLGTYLLWWCWRECGLLSAC